VPPIREFFHNLRQDVARRQHEHLAARRDVPNIVVSLKLVPQRILGVSGGVQRCGPGDSDRGRRFHLTHTRNVDYRIGW
jgi:hypothetical protein